LSGKLVDAELIDEDAAVVDLVEAGHAVEECRLPGAGRAITARNWPRGTTRSSPWSATTESAPDRYTFRTHSATRIGFGCVSFVLITPPPSAVET
jgi:hypothetical protein